MRFLLALALVIPYASGQQGEATSTNRYAPADPPEWNLPVQPFRVVGNIYYVGAANVSSYLVTTDEGHILIEAGFRETVPLIEASVKQLGFRFSDIRLLLASHAHYDHAGGLAEVKARTGARFLSSSSEAAMFSRGGKDDFAFGDKYPFPPIRPDALIRDGEVIQLGGVSITAHLTPGHTKGCMTFSTRVQEDQRSYDVVFPCSLSAPGYQLVGNARYPEIFEDYERTIAKLRALPCDIFLQHHRSAFRMIETSRTRAEDGRGNPFVDPDGYHAYLDRALSTIREQRDAQSSADTP